MVTPYCPFCGSPVHPESRDTLCNVCLAVSLHIPAEARANLVRYLVPGGTYGARWKDYTLECIVTSKSVESAPAVLTWEFESSVVEDGVKRVVMRSGSKVGAWRVRITCPETDAYVEMEYDANRRKRVNVRGVEEGWTATDQALVRKGLALLDMVPGLGRPEGPTVPEIKRWVDHCIVLASELGSLDRGEKAAYVEFKIQKGYPARLTYDEFRTHYELVAHSC